MADTQRNHQELCLLYENAAANLEALKKSQWQVYVFYSAVAAALISQAENIKEPYIKICLSVLLVIGMLVVEFYEAHFRFKMKEYRDILVGIYEYFGHPFREIRIGAKGVKTYLPDNFERVFKYGGCAYIFVVSFLAINTLWPKDHRIEYSSIICPLSTIIVFSIFIPFIMGRLVNYLDRKTKEKISAK